MATACSSVQEEAVPSSHPDARHFSSSPYATGALQTVSPVLEPRGSKSMCGALQEKTPGNPQFLPLTQSLLVFIGRSYGDLSSCHWSPCLGGLVLGWDPSRPRYLPPYCYPPHVSVGTARSSSPHLQVSNPATHLDECGFFNSLVVALPYSSIF